MRIILLTGKPHSQKTTTLNMVYAQLTQGIKNPPPKQKIKNAPAADFECILSYKGNSVAIFSLGDILYRVYEAIIKYSNVDVLIIAHSQGGNAKNSFSKVVGSFTQHCVIHKTTSNPNDCQNIISHI
jgi:tRNA uridine 5-carbamoylmethylation protein Kti12